MKADKILKAAAVKANMDLVGFADLKLLDEIREKYADYEEKIPFFKGKFADRLNIRKEWDKAKSAVVFALSYNTKETEKTIYDREHGLISKCARGEDYHIVLKRYADKLITEFCREYPCNYLFYADNGILSDKMLAYCAGLGFIGKNNLLINETYGSFIFIGHILLDIDIEFERIKPVNCKCDKCKLCIENCPTKAYSEEKCYEYDKCISYNTQKNNKCDKTTYIYGCDVCQLKCPFNENAEISRHCEFCSSSDIYNPKLNVITEMTQEEYEKIYGASSLSWRGLRTLKNNCRKISEG